MDARKKPHSRRDDVPIIGDYSAASDPRRSAEPTHAHAWRAGGADPWRAEPVDPRRQAELARQRERAARLRRVRLYALVALAAVGIFAVYWNAATLREVTVDFSSLTDAFADRSGNGPGARSILSSEPDTVEVESSGVAGDAIATSGGPADTQGDEPAAAPSADGTASAEPTLARSEPPAEAPADPPASAAATRAEPPLEPETLEFGLPTVTVSEADASAAVIVLRYGNRGRASSFTWWTGDGTASEDTDYVNRGRVVERFAAGEQNRTIHVPLVGDRNVEGAETFYVYLAAPEGAGANAERARLEVVIEDDD